MTAASGGLGAVVIGRNEGERLRGCLASLLGRVDRVVYVDSGSTDGSSGLARTLGAEVVDLDLSTPFTAARARNAGLDRLLELAPDLEFVQFVDGDCELADGWIRRALEAMAGRTDAAVVCGRRRERHPGATVYNRLADMEWDTPIGEASACGGDAMMRVGPLREVGGYNPFLIAGEEPELCVRLRAKGWKVLRIDAEMTLHDMGMTRFSQWWRRAVRAGHAYAEGAALHGAPPERFWVRETRSNWFWGLAVPAGAIALAWPTRGLSLLAAAAGYTLILWWRAARWGRSRGWAADDSALFGLACGLAKFPMAIGQARYATARWRGRRSALIEYKGSLPPRPKVPS
jgi:glycosyltransferase involved in cell wall biosynthesis